VAPDQPDAVQQLAKLTEAVRALESRLAPVEGLDAEAAAHFLGISRSTFYSLEGRGLVPEPVVIGESQRRWRMTELRAWLAAGAPSRREWAGLRHAALRRTG
jgi:predicted DNA-binding transcriptional regulator AlpA